MAQDLPRPSGGRKAVDDCFSQLGCNFFHESISHPNKKVGKIIKRQVRDGICEFPGKGICQFAFEGFVFLSTEVYYFKGIFGPKTRVKMLAGQHEVN